MKKRRTRIDSAAEQVRIMSQSAKQIHPPSTVPLGEADLPFFANVINEVAKSEWTPHQIEIAALLARTMADWEREQIEMREEGTVITTPNGALTINPRKTVIQMHANTIVAYRRSLGLHARAQGETRDIAKRRQMAKQIENESPLDDELLARPQ